MGEAGAAVPQQQTGAAETGRRFVAAVAVATVVPWLVVPLCQQFPSARWVVVALALVTGAAHTVPTLGFYIDPELAEHRRRHPFRYRVGPLACIVGEVVVGVLLGGLVLTLGVVAYSGWRLHHFAKQNLGVFSFVCRARRVPGASALERRLIVASGPVAMLGFVGMLDHFEGIDVPMASAMRTVGGVAMVGLIVAALVVGSGDRVRFGALLSAVGFFAPLFFTSDPVVAVSGYTAAHGAQYLFMSSHLAAGRRSSLGWFAAGGLAVVAGGWFLTYGLDHIAPTSWAYALGAGFAMAHFVVDAGCWRPSDPDHRAWMQRRFAFL